MRELESLKEAGSRGAGLRILIGRKTGSSYTSDLSPEGIERLVRAAIELAEITTEDPHAGSAGARRAGHPSAAIWRSIRRTSRAWRRPSRSTLAKRAEEAALSADPRITNSEGASFDTHVGRHIFANSRGFAGEYRTSYCSLAHGAGGPRRRLHGARLLVHLGARDSPGWKRRKQVGRTAAAARPAPAEPGEGGDAEGAGGFRAAHRPQRCSTTFSTRCTACPIYRHESFLAGKLGEKVARENVTVVDDGTIPGLFGTSPFDDEGVPSRRTVVIDRGVLKSYLLNTYAARKLGMKTTGNASRGLTGNAGIGHGNFFVGEGRPNAGADRRRHLQRVLRHRADRLRREHRHRGLFARRGGVVDPQWRAGVSPFPRSPSPAI